MTAATPLERDTADHPAGGGRRYRVVYIAGTGRSGSTVVAQCLERRTAGVHVGELRYLWVRGVGENHLCECGQPFDRCEFWTAVLARAHGANAAAVADELAVLAPDVDRIRRIPQTRSGLGAHYQRKLARFAELQTPLYDAIAEVAGTDLIIDSSKDPSYLYVLSRLPGLDVAPVHLVRDPRAVAYSWTRRRRRPEIHWREQYMRTLRPRRSALIWLEYNLAIDLFASRAASSTRVRYEDFVADPEASVARICRELDLGMIWADTPRTGHSLSGNPMRFQRGPLVVRADTEWKRGLPARHRRLVTALTSPLLRRYGYRMRR